MSAERMLARIYHREKRRALVWAVILLGLWLLSWVVLVQTLPLEERSIELTEEEQWEELAYYYPIDL